jgi:hypothetical protein
VQLPHILVSADLVVANVTIVMPDVAVVSIAVMTILPQILPILLSIDLSWSGVGVLRQSTSCEQGG